VLDPGNTFRSYNYVQATPKIATSGAIPAEEFRQIAQAGYRTVINLLPEKSQYALQDEPSIVAALGMAYIHIAVEFDAPTVEDFDRFRAAMLAKSDTSVWVHCAANKRVSAFVALYGQLELGWTTDQATEFLAAIWEPTDPWLSLSEEVLAREHSEA
jgi:uncharacterized protein (TIGR01244 family)